jgi:NADPH:quinone reductase-like Zn-dependent oxidoreductase
MKAVVMHETGGPEVLRREDVDAPEPDDGEVLIRVRAASVNPIDWKYRRGYADKAVPAVLGEDAAGTVEVSRADGYAEGDEVFGFVSSGGYAELATASAGAVARKPDGVSSEQAAAIPVAGITAWQALFDRGGLQSGQTALVAGAAGGVGHFAVQFAKQAGARVVGTGSTRNREFVLGLGADDYVDYTEQDAAERSERGRRRLGHRRWRRPGIARARRPPGRRRRHHRRRPAGGGGAGARSARRAARVDPEPGAARPHRRPDRIRGRPRRARGGVLPRRGRAGP